MGVFSNDAATPVAVVVVPGQIPELSALMVPVLARLTVSNNIPELVVVPAAPSRCRPAVELIAAMTPTRMLIVHAGRIPHIPAAVRNIKTYVHFLPDEPAEASLEVASRYWGAIETAVFAEDSDPESIILGSALAAQKGAPLLLVCKRLDSRIASLLQKKQVKRIYRLLPRNHD